MDGRSAGLTVDIYETLALPILGKFFRLKREHFALIPKFAEEKATEARPFTDPHVVFSPLLMAAQFKIFSAILSPPQKMFQAAGGSSVLPRTSIEP